jgi:hypothetical protein
MYSLGNMSATASMSSTPLMIAGHRIVAVEQAGEVLSLRIALQGQPLPALGQRLAQLDGVSVTSGPQGLGRERCLLVHCPGFKVVLSTEPGHNDMALALVSRAPQAALAVISELAGLLERLLTAPPAVVEVAVTPSKKKPSDEQTKNGSFLKRGSSLKQGKPLARGKPLQRRTPLARGSWR